MKGIEACIGACNHVMYIYVWVSDHVKQPIQAISDTTPPASLILVLEEEIDSQNPPRKFKYPMYSLSFFGNIPCLYDKRQFRQSKHTTPCIISTEKRHIMRQTYCPFPNTFAYP